MSLAEDDDEVWTPVPVAVPGEPGRFIPTVYVDRESQLTDFEVKVYPHVPNLPECEECGLQHVTHNGYVSCKGHRTHGRGPCRRFPIGGMTVCPTHGGSAPAAKRKAKEKAAEQAAKRSLKDVDIVSIGNPIDELAELAAEVLAIKDHFGDVVGELGDQYRFVDDKGAEQLDARVGMYERALDRCQKVLSELARIGFEEQRLRLDEKRAALVFLFFNGILKDLGLALDDENVQRALGRWAGVLDGADAPDDIVDAEVVDE